MKENTSLRKKILKQLFTEQEQVAIINALYRRSKDFSTNFIEGDESVRNTCESIANEMTN